MGKYGHKLASVMLIITLFYCGDVSARFSSPTSAIRKLRVLVNKERSKRKLPLLKNDSHGCKSIARDHAKWLASRTKGPYKPHHNYVKRLSRIPGQYRVSENVVWTGTRHGLDSAHALKLWMNSRKHRKEILRRKNISVGMAVVKAKNGKHYWTQCFVGRR